MAGIIFSESSGVNDSVFGKSQEPIKLFVEKKAETWEEQSAIDKIYSIDTSKNAMEKLTSMTSMNGFMPTGEGGAYPHDEMQEGYDKVLSHITWKDSFTITQEMVEDSKLMDFRSRPASFISGFYRTREMYGAALLAGGLAGTSATFRGQACSTAGADGKALFAKDHPAKVKGKAQTNLFAGAFSNENLAKLEARMQDFRDDNGNVLSVIPDTIIIPNDGALKLDVFAAIGADKDPDTSNNGFNFTFGRWNVIVWQYLNQFMDLTTDKPYILLASGYNEENGGAVWLDRIKLEVKSYIDENTDNNVWKGRARFVAGFNDWRAFAVGGVTGGSTL